MELLLDGHSLTIDQLYRASDGNTSLSIAKSARTAMQKSRNTVEQWIANKEIIYGVTTGFGEFSNVHIPMDKIEALQRNLIMSHAAGAGEPLPDEVVRCMMILRANALAKGFSGIRPETVEFIMRFFNAGIVLSYLHRVPLDHPAISSS